jgi:hypothetical protein
MAVAKLKISKSGVSGTLVLGMFKDHTWHLESPVSWFPGGSGQWGRVRNATKFRQFSFLRLANESGQDIADFPEPPYTLQQKFTANLISHFWFFESPGGEFDVEVVECPPPTKSFELRETWAASASYVVVQGEAAGFEIKDVTSGASTIYIYKGLGLTIGLPKIPFAGKAADAANKVKDSLSVGGVSSSGPPNPFTAPGYLSIYDFEGDATLQTIYNVGLGTDKSANVLDFGGNVDNKPGFLVHIPNFSTGRTFSLPSTGFSSGSMTLLSNASGTGSGTAQPTAACGKFGCRSR